MSTNQSECTIFSEVRNLWNAQSHAIESSSKWQDARDFESAVQKACQVCKVEKLFPEQFKTVKTFISTTGLLVSLQTGFERSLVFSSHQILSQVRWI